MACVKTQFTSNIKNYYQNFKTCEVHSRNQINTGRATDLKRTSKCCSLYFIIYPRMFYFRGIRMPKN